MTPLRDARKKAGLTQEELARILGVSHVTISKYESGTITLPVNQAKKIAAALGIKEWYTLYPDFEQHDVMMEDVLKRPAQSLTYTQGTSLTEEERFINDYLERAEAEKEELEEFYEQNDVVDKSLPKEIDVLIERLAKTKGSWKKMPPADFLQTFASLTFKSEDDRIAYYYSRLNDTGRAEATRCFFRHLDEQSKKDVADYVQRLAADPRYTSDTGALLPADTTPKD